MTLILENFAALRQTNYCAPIFVEGNEIAGDDGAGIFQTDGTTNHNALNEDDGGLRIVDGLGRLWVRQLDNDVVHAKWWLPKTGNAENNSSIWDDAISAATYLVTKKKSATIKWPGGDFYFGQKLLPLTNGISLAGSGHVRTEFHCNFALPSGVFSGTAKTPPAFDSFELPFGDNEGYSQANMEANLQVEVMEEDADNIYRPVLKELGTHYTVSTPSMSSTTTVTFTSIIDTPPTGKPGNVFIYHKIDCGFIKIDAQQVSISENPVIQNSYLPDGPGGSGVAILVYAREKAKGKRDFGDDIKVEAEISALTNWDVGVFLNGREKVKVIEIEDGVEVVKETAGIRDTFFPHIVVFLCKWAGLYFSHTLTSTIQDSQVYPGGITTWYDTIISGDASKESQNVRMNANAINNILIDHANNVSIEAINLVNLYRTTNAVNVGVITADEVKIETINTDRFINYGRVDMQTATAGNTLNVLHFSNENGVSSGYIGMNSIHSDDFYIGSEVVNRPFYQFSAGDFHCESVGAGEFFWKTDSKAMKFDGSALFPELNNNIDLGEFGKSFADIYSVNAVTQTSDRREKTCFSYFDDMPERAFEAYETFANSLRPLMYKWKNSGKRSHAGFIAQDVLSACEKAKLNPDDMAFFIKSEVWDDVPVLDENGEPKMDKLPSGDIPVTESIQRLNEDGTPYEKLGLRMNELMTVLYAVQQVKQVRLEDRVAALEA